MHNYHRLLAALLVLALSFGSVNAAAKCLHWTEKKDGKKPQCLISDGGDDGNGTSAYPVDHQNGKGNGSPDGISPNVGGVAGKNLDGSTSAKPDAGDCQSALTAAKKNCQKAVRANQASCQSRAITDYRVCIANSH